MNGRYVMGGGGLSGVFPVQSLWFSLGGDCF